MIKIYTTSYNIYNIKLHIQIRCIKKFSGGYKVQNIKKLLAILHKLKCLFHKANNL